MVQLEIPFDIIKSNTQNSEWVVFIHGFGGSRRMFKKQVDKFKEHFNIMVLDLPGHGISRDGIVSGNNIKISINDIAKSILEVIHKLGITKANFIGISLGTLIVASIIMIEPQAVQKAILGGAVCGVNIVLNAFIHIIGGLKRILPYTFVVASFARIMMPRGNHKLSRTFMIKESNNLGKEEFIGWFDLVIHNLNYLKNNMERLVKTQGMFIMGSQDYVFRRRVKRVVNKYKLKLGILDKCGHVCNIDKSAEFNEMALNYLLKK